MQAHAEFTHRSWSSSRFMLRLRMPKVVTVLLRLIALSNTVASLPRRCKLWVT
jgi:hypothetical protein